MEGDNNRNVIVWMDHRALAETAAINQGGYDVLKYVGGSLSPEMETPKLKWLKTHLPQTWVRAGKFLDLADFLTYRSTGSNARSLCTVVCKWTYLGHEGQNGQWDRNYFDAIGIGDALEGEKIGNDVRPMGTPLGTLTPAAAAELGLTTQCHVGVGIIDAHAGGLGLLGAVFQDEPEYSATEGYWKRVQAKREAIPRSWKPRLPSSAVQATATWPCPANLNSSTEYGDPISARWFPACG